VIGNSSVIIRESEVYGTPAINIGTRQQNRSKNDDIINVNPKKKEILDAIQKSNLLKLEPKSFFGDTKNSTEQFFEILNDSLIWKNPIQKQFVDNENFMQRSSKIIENN